MPIVSLSTFSCCRVGTNMQTEMTGMKSFQIDIYARKEGTPPTGCLLLYRCVIKYGVLDSL